MSLDITKVAPQIAEMTARIKQERKNLLERLRLAYDKLCDEKLDLGLLEHKIKTARTPWVVAGLYEGLSRRFPFPFKPEDYTVVATDGSHISVDRHRTARCYLINVGSVRLQYGQNPLAELESTPLLYSDERDLVIRCGEGHNREQAIEGALLDIKRSNEELRKLSEMLDNPSLGGRILALMDGSLVLFGMENYPEFVVEEMLDRCFIKALDRIYQITESKELALASYISFPRSTDVVNALRVACCPFQMVNCEHNCPSGEAPCEMVAGINDRLLFEQVLNTGERSCLFINPSLIMKRYDRHRVYFFYLKVDEEIARVEVPEWVARQPERVDLVHALVLDQCRRGQGYPVALSEAHEQAVVTGADREEFWALVEGYFTEGRMPMVFSGKSRSKRTRWI